MKSFRLATALLFYSGFTFSQVHSIPFCNNSVMIDGRFEPEEWKHSLQLTVNDSTSLLLQQDDENIYWCLHTRSEEPQLMMVDFYFLQNDEKLNLHASAKLGERTWSPTGYGEWIWWNNEKWQANISRNKEYDARIFLRDEAKEFQLRKSRFGAKEFSLMLNISYPQNMMLNFPENANPENPDHWLHFQLESEAAA